MRAKKEIISTFVVFAVIFQSLFVANGLLGICIMEAKALCTCNHSSKKEIHSNPEDVNFSSKSIQYKNSKAQSLPLVKEHSSMESNSAPDSHNQNATAKLLPDCHSAKSNEAHLCSCKKQKQSSESLNPHLQSFFTFKSYTLTKPELLSIDYHFSKNTNILEGVRENLFKPPKYS